MHCPAETYFLRTCTCEQIAPLCVRNRFNAARWLPGYLCDYCLTNRQEAGVSWPCFWPRLGWHPEEIFDFKRCAQYYLTLFILNGWVFLVKSIQKELHGKRTNQWFQGRSCSLPNGVNYLCQLSDVTAEPPGQTQTSRKLRKPRFLCSVMGT